VRILLAEDDGDMRAAIAESLEAAGATVQTATTGHQAFDRFARERPQIVVSDLWMPSGDGFELMRRIRALPPEQGGRTPGIALSAAADAEHALAAKYDKFLRKPFALAKLITAIAELVAAAE
jgi:CheY-like chemotaxis protein